MRIAVKESSQMWSTMSFLGCYSYKINRDKKDLAYALHAMNFQCRSNVRKTETVSTNMGYRRWVLYVHRRQKQKFYSSYFIPLW